MKSYNLEKLDQLFLRYNGWSGADGVFSFKYENEILLYFSDTFIGNATKDKIRLNYTLINNSLAIYNKNGISFYYPNNPINSVFLPDNKENYYWLQDGIIENNKLYILALLMKNDIFSNEIFQIEGIDLIQLDLPFNKKISYQCKNIFSKTSSLILGTSILKKDNYYYLFSYLNDYNNKKLVLARTNSLHFNNIEYLNKNGLFSNNLNDLLVLKEFFSSEFKVVFKKGYFYIAYIKYSIGNKIYLIRTKDICKPFTEEILLYETSLHSGNIITYNAKIQEAFSNDKYLVISYNVNSLNNDDHKNLDIYRPHFFKVLWEDIENEFEKK